MSIFRRKQEQPSYDYFCTFPGCHVGSFFSGFCPFHNTPMLTNSQLSDMDALIDAMEEADDAADWDAEYWESKFEAVK